MRKEEERARRELIKQEYLRRKQRQVLEEQGLGGPKAKPRKPRPKSVHREEPQSDSGTKCSSTRKLAPWCGRWPWSPSPGETLRCGVVWAASGPWVFLLPERERGRDEPVAYESAACLRQRITSAGPSRPPACPWPLRRRLSPRAFIQGARRPSGKGPVHLGGAPSRPSGKGPVGEVVLGLAVGRLHTSAPGDAQMPGAPSTSSLPSPPPPILP